MEIYKGLDKEFFTKDQTNYYRAIFMVLLGHAKVGKKYVKIYMPTEDGTKFIFKEIASIEEAYDYKKELLNLLERFNKKYNTKLVLEPSTPEI